MSTVYNIGSFNMYKLNFASNDETKKDFKKIAKIIKDEKFDIVALQEVLNENVVKSYLIPALGVNWDYSWSSPTPYTSSSNEGYAYIWNTRRVHLVGSETKAADDEENKRYKLYRRENYNKPNSNPVIYGWYRIKDKRDMGNGGLIRPPYVARFTSDGLPGGCYEEIRLINTHIIFGKTSNSEIDMGDIAVRKAELKVLAEEIYRRVWSKTYKENSMPSFTILLGDYNLCLVGNGGRIKEYIELDESRKLHVVQNELTTLKQVPKDGEKPLTEFFSNDYDHFAYESGFDEKMTIKASRVNALESYLNNDLAEYRRTISDHVPIKLEVDLKKNKGVDF